LATAQADQAKARRRGASCPFSMWRQRSSVESVSSRFSRASACSAADQHRAEARREDGGGGHRDGGPKRRHAKCPIARHQKKAHRATAARGELGDAEQLQLIACSQYTRMACRKRSTPLSVVLPQSLP
jgi:hypothetical protein